MGGLTEFGTLQKLTKKRSAVPTRGNSGVKQVDPVSALSCQLVQHFCQPFGGEDGAWKALVIADWRDHRPMAR